MDNKIRYEQERESRWSMAKEKEPDAIAAICSVLSQKTGRNIMSQRYDKIWFEKYNPSLAENEWVRGASDYTIDLGNNRYLYAEIKLKSVRFKKTLYGGITQKGSVVANYGCESFYLDIVPVYKNMCSFVKKAHIKDDSFIIFFINEELTEIHAISLQEIEQLIQQGYNAAKICIFSEGYGTNTEYGAAPNYLIPVNSTHNLKDTDWDYFMTHSTDSLITDIPVNPRPIFAYNSGFYHKDRNCKFIKYKPDAAITVFNMETEAKLKGYKPCMYCCPK